MQLMKWIRGLRKPKIQKPDFIPWNSEGYGTYKGQEGYDLLQYIQFVGRFVKRGPMHRWWYMRELREICKRPGLNNFHYDEALAWIHEVNQQEAPAPSGPDYVMYKVEMIARMLSKVDAEAEVTYAFEGENIHLYVTYPEERRERSYVWVMGFPASEN